MKRILNAITAVFPDFNSKDLTSELNLGQIRNYDSMNAVNLFVSLQEQFGVDLAIEEVPLDRSNKIGDIVAFFERKGISLNK